ncbi:MAG: efflux RND transporter periplasmic adaptor subunit, partial [Rhodothermales bacterium]
ADREILYWQAPMNPEEIYDSPGKSNMGMDLVPVYADEEPTEGTVRIDPVTVQNMGIRTARVERGPFARTIRAVGNIVYNEETLYTVSTKISGWVEALHVDYTGQDVRKGDVLLEIYSPELVSTQKEYLLALRTLEMVENGGSEQAIADARSLTESARQRLLYWDIDESVIDDLERTGEVLRTLPLRAPASGVVVHKNIQAGKYISAGVDVYRIADLSTVWLEANLYDNEIPWIEVGQRARVEMSYVPGKTYTGRVDFVYPYLNENERHVRVRLVFPNPGYQLKPGMYANVLIDVPTRDDVLKIPERAVIRSGTRNVALVARGEGKFEPRELELGAEGGDEEVEVLSGLREGEEIVTSSQFLLDSESRLQEAIQKMLALKSEPARADTDAGTTPDVIRTPDAPDGNVDMPGMDHEASGAAESETVEMPEMPAETREEPEHVHSDM